MSEAGNRLALILEDKIKREKIGSVLLFQDEATSIPQIFKNTPIIYL